MSLGRHHPTIRRLRALRRDPARRAAESVFVAEGVHLVQETLDSDVPIEFVLVTQRLKDREEGRRLLRRIAQRELPCLETADVVLESVQDARSPQPILALVRRPVWPPGAGWDPSDPPPLIVVAHGVQDPGNLGAILRTAHAAGATACCVCGESADPFHPRAVRASMGSILHLPLIVESCDALLRRLGEQGIAVLGADPAGEVDYHACDFRRACAVFFGSEGQGLPLELLARLEERIRVPLRPGVDSLSVGASAAVLLFEAARQRGGGVKS